MQGREPYQIAGVDGLVDIRRDQRPNRHTFEEILLDFPAFRL
jgi:hypothetical protein